MYLIYDKMPATILHEIISKPCQRMVCEISMVGSHIKPFVRIP